jgi:hypothetical protein
MQLCGTAVVQQAQDSGFYLQHCTKIEIKPVKSILSDINWY